MKKRGFLAHIVNALLFGLVINGSAQAVALEGFMSVDGGVATGGVPTGSYFTMGGFYVPLLPGSEGGIALGQYQNFVLDPDEPHPDNWDGNGALAGTGYGLNPVSESGILQAFNFFGNPTYVGTNPISYQSGNAHAAPTASLGLCVGTVCDLSVDLSAWEVMWNGSAFEQGPRPDQFGPFVLALGTYDTVTGAYVLDWDSQINGGPFNSVVASWHLEGVVSTIPVPAAVWLFGSGLFSLLAFSRSRRPV